MLEPHERRILFAVINGRKNSEIQAVLGYTQRSVQTKVSNVVGIIEKEILSRVGYARIQSMDVEAVQRARLQGRLHIWRMRYLMYGKIEGEINQEAPVSRVALLREGYIPLSRNTTASEYSHLSVDYRQFTVLIGRKLYIHPDDLKLYRQTRMSLYA